MSEIPRSLGPGVVEVVAAGNDPTCTLDLRTLKPGNLLRVCLAGSRRNPWDFVVVKPPPKDAGIDGTLALETELPLRTWSYPQAVDDDTKTVRVYIVGACTRNPGAPLGMSMLHFHHLTVGRSVCVFGSSEDGSEEEGIIFAKPVESIEVITPHDPS